MRKKESGGKELILQRISDVRKNLPEVSIPFYATEDSSGFDLKAYLHLDLYEHNNGELLDGNRTFIDKIQPDGTFSITIYPMGRMLIKTGISIEIPKGYELQIRPRSGLALKKGITVLNTPGTIDADYRGDIGVILINLGNREVVINHGERIAQAVLAKVEKAKLVEGKIKETKRGDGGFGSTGV